MEKTWIEAVLAESRAITKNEINSCKLPKVARGEKVVNGGGGWVASEELKQIYALAKKYKKRAETAESLWKITAETCPNREVAITKMEENSRACTGKAKSVEDMFLITLRSEFRLWGKPSVGIREGWQAVWSPRRRTSSEAQISALF